MGTIFSFISSKFSPTEDNSNDYTPLRKLGEGGFGEVWEVQSKQTGEVYARKEFKRQLRVDPDDVKEIAVLRNLGTHMNIVQLIDVIVCEKTYLIMEYCDLGDLDGFLRRNNVNLRKVLSILMTDMIKGLHFLHGKDVAHRDLKPANILLKSTSSRPICKIADFGLSKFVNPHSQELNINSVSAGSYLYTDCGSQFYTAPEIGEGKYKKACDIFSLGAIFFVLFSQQRNGQGKQSLLAPTINGRTLCQVTDLQIKSSVEGLRLRGQPEGYRRMIRAMLKQNYRKRVNIGLVYKMHRHYIRS